MEGHGGGGGVGGNHSCDHRPVAIMMVVARATGAAMVRWRQRQGNGGRSIDRVVRVVF